MPSEFDHAGNDLQRRRSKISPIAFTVTLLVAGAVAIWLKAEM